MELLGDGLARQQATLADEQPSALIECSACQHDLLRADLEHSPLTRVQKAKEETHCASAEGLEQVSNELENEH